MNNHSKTYEYIFGCENVQKLLFCLVLFPVCSVYTEAVKNNQPPHIVFDTTITNVASETVKSLTSALGLPTVSASFGQEGDIRQWRDLNDQKRQYLLQVMPPSDIIPGKLIFFIYNC